MSLSFRWWEHLIISSSYKVCAHCKLLYWKECPYKGDKSGIYSKFLAQHIIWIFWISFPFVSSAKMSSQSRISCVFVWATDLVWTIYRCTRLSEWVGDQRCRHQGCWKARSQCCPSLLFLFISLLSPSHTCHLLAAVFFSVPALFSLCLLIIFSCKAFFFLTDSLFIHALCRPLVSSVQFNFSSIACSLLLLL